MSRIKLNSVILVVLIGLISSCFIINVNAYPGDGDCSDYHGITYIQVPVVSSTGAIIDGNPSEDFWSENAVPTEVILASIEPHGVIPELYSLSISFVMNSQYLYILCQWGDNTPQYDFPPEKDGLDFCWDIDTVNFSAYYVSDMNTLHMGNGSIDAWRWTYDGSIFSGEQHLCIDDCFDEDGWVQGNPEAKNIEVAFTNDSNSYTLEMRRALNTNEIYDVQFTEKKIYKFNLAIMNDSYGLDHAVSWTYALDLRETEQIITGVNLELFVILSSFLIVTIYILKLKKKLKIY
jgi:hypothetical protein